MAKDVDMGAISSIINSVFMGTGAILQGSAALVDSKNNAKVNMAAIGANERVSIAGIGANERVSIAGIGANERVSIANIGMLEKIGLADSESFKKHAPKIFMGVGVVLFLIVIVAIAKR